MRGDDTIDWDGGRCRGVSSALWGWVWAGLLVCGGACSEADRSRTASEGISESANVDIVEKFENDAETILAAEARRRAESASVATLLDRAEEATATSADTESANSERKSDQLELRHAELLEYVYGARGHELVWYVDRGGELEPAEATETLREMLIDAVAAHGLWPEQFHLETVRSADTSSVGWGASWKGASLDEEKREKILEYLADRGLDLDAAGDMQRLAGIVADSDGPLPELANRVEKGARRIEGEIRRVAQRELMLTDALAEYLIEMRYGNPVWHQPRAARATFRLGDHGPLRAVSLAGEAYDETPAGLVRDAVDRARTRTMTVEKTVEIFEEPSSVDDAMRSVQPPFRQYHRLTRAFEQYRSYVENGGWPELPESAEGLQLGSYSPDVPTLKERLWIEGYWEPPEGSGASNGDSGRAKSNPSAEAESGRYFTERFDDRLEEALSTYQQTHQFYTKGILRGPTLSSLNVSARERWNQIRVTLERWRNSRIGADDHYVHVNIPDFHAEVWRGGDRKMRFRVITGSSKRKKNEETGDVTYTRATPQFSDEVEYIVFNPFWNVPESIRENEIKPKLRKDPSYLERNNFEVVEDEHGNQFIRQTPGPENSLGHIKFLFPNEHSVYMHDTPERFLFNKPTRGYSHGCIRIEDPKKFAEYLLDLDGRWTGHAQEEQMEEWLEKKEEHWVTLEQTLPVHIEYYVVRVDGRGRAHFLADLYDHDEPRLERIEQRLQSHPDNYDLPQREVDELMAAALAGNLDN